MLPTLRPPKTTATALDRSCNGIDLYKSKVLFNMNLLKNGNGSISEDVQWYTYKEKLTSR